MPDADIYADINPPIPRITAEQFRTATGRDALMDDLERCNCPLAGTMGHAGCGWNAHFNLPNFLVPML